MKTFSCPIIKLSANIFDNTLASNEKVLFPLLDLITSIKLLC